MWFLKKHWVLFLVIISTLFAFLPLFQSGFFPMHDDEQVARLFDLHQALTLGQFPPRISPNLGYGYGYPFFNFYPSFAYYVAEIFVIMGFGYIFSTKIMIVLGFVLASVFMYQFTKQYFGNIGGLISAFLYTYAPYHAMDVYVRGALAEFWSFVFIPAIFWGYYLLSKKSNIYIFILQVFFLSGLILSHNLVAIMTVPFVGVYWVFLLTTSKKKQQFFFYSFFTIFFSLSLTAYFWMPSYFEKQYTLVEILTKELADYNLHYVCPSQFWNSAWGYGASLVGCQTDGLSFQVGKLQIVLAFISILYIYFFKTKRKIYFVVLVFFNLFLFSLYIQTKYSKFIWDFIQQLSYIQFPWRFLIFSVFTSSFLSGSIFIFPLQKNLKMLIGVGIFILAILINKDYFQPERYLNSVTDFDYTNIKKIRWDTSNLAYEYVPKGIVTKKSAIGTTIININENEYSRSAFHIKDGKMKVLVKKNLPQDKKFIVDVEEPGKFVINVFDFPGWIVSVNSNKVMYESNNKFKLITIYLPKGKYTIDAKFEDTSVRKSANWISFGAIIGLMAVFFANIFAFYVLKRVK